VVSVAENEDLTEAMSDVARQLVWNGVRAETRIIVPNGAAIPEMLASAGQEWPLAHARDPVWQLHACRNSHRR